MFAAGVPYCSVVTLPCFWQTTHWLEILQALLLSPSQELQHRGAVVVLNMVEASREIASTLMESEVLEIREEMRRLPPEWERENVAGWREWCGRHFPQRAVSCLGESWTPRS